MTFVDPAVFVTKFVPGRLHIPVCHVRWSPFEYSLCMQSDPHLRGMVERTYYLLMNTMHKLVGLAEHSVHVDAVRVVD